jgi:hypothetical protein
VRVSVAHSENGSDAAALTKEQVARQGVKISASLQHAQREGAFGGARPGSMVVVGESYKTFFCGLSFHHRNNGGSGWRHTHTPQQSTKSIKGDKIYSKTKADDEELWYHSMKTSLT